MSWSAPPLLGHRALLPSLQPAGCVTVPWAAFRPRRSSARQIGAVCSSRGLAEGRARTHSRDATLSTTRRILSAPDIEGDPLKLLKRAEAYWKALKEGTTDRVASGTSKVVGVSKRTVDALDYDVCICGGTLGLFLGLALQQRGHRVCIVEKQTVAGRTQEWNTSRHEVQVLADLGLLSREELENTIATEFNPVRVGFHGGSDHWIKDVMNIGISPKRLIQIMKSKFAAFGGAIMEETAFRSAEVASNGVNVNVSRSRTAAQRDAASLTWSSTGRGVLTCRLLLDCMGHYSAIVKQIRGDAKPAGMCFVVGGCAQGVPSAHNQTADVLRSISDSERDMQLFWEAFPAEGGAARTMYMFTYADANAARGSIESLLDLYFARLPLYQGVPIERLSFKRVLFGAFPCYSDGPLRTPFPRVLQIGDAAAAHSPLSFGGFGSMLRHVRRLTCAVHQALGQDRLSQRDLALLQPYQPSLSCAWLFQRSMSIRVGQVQATPHGGANGHTPGSHDSLTPRQAAHGTRAEWPDRVQQERAGDAARLKGSMRRASHGIITHGEASEGVAGARALPDGARGDGTAKGVVAGGAQRSRGCQGAGESGPDTADSQCDNKRGYRNGSSRTQAMSLAKAKSDLKASDALPANHVNKLLMLNFSVMTFLGQGTVRLFLQDTIQFFPLLLTMWGMMLVRPLLIMRVIRHLRLGIVVSWFFHFIMLGVYTLLYWVTKPFKRLIKGFFWQRIFDILEFGSGYDYNQRHTTEWKPQGSGCT